MTKQKNSPETNIRLGSTVIIFDGKTFTFQHAHEVHEVISIDEADIPDLVAFLDQIRDRSRKHIRDGNDRQSLSHE